eukprot:TRINITY_DN5539_c0_g1_i2.p3 TRINITY_DN5539_c0_g1~~TRINITY_DN5539_c0_g1_i2.p3  ORF type:complete len:163 (+),score=46.59 TRINITY_DN5539_c0_g1_i2:1870-2358(+)
MPHSFGYRARTRDLFSQDFRKGGLIPVSTYVRNFKVGQYVDIKANPAVHKGMPHKFYHGKTGKVFNVTKRAIGVEVNKLVKHRILKKRFHIRIEHAVKSRCREEFLNRVKANDKLKNQAKKEGKTISTKRPVEGQPKAAKTVKLHGKKTPKYIRPQEYFEIF